MKSINFLKEVKQEALKVKWPSLRDVSVISFIVFLAVSIAGALLLVVDTVIYRLIKAVLGIGG